MASIYCPEVIKRFLPHLSAENPAKRSAAKIRKFLAVSIPPLSARVVDRVFDISGRQIGVITLLVANIISPPQEAKSSFVNLVFMFNRIGAKVWFFVKMSG